MTDAWGKLWDIATSEAGDPAIIFPFADNAGEVLLRWPDGSESAWHWDNDEWVLEEELNTCPGDIAARDSL